MLCPLCLLSWRHSLWAIYRAQTTSIRCESHLAFIAWNEQWQLANGVVGGVGSLVVVAMMVVVVPLAVVVVVMVVWWIVLLVGA